MTEKIKVYLQYPWRFPDSPYYKNLIETPPSNINYLNTKSQGGAITNVGKFRFLNSLKSLIRNTLNFFNFAVPNAHLTRTDENYGLIHCAHCLSLNKKPWVADFEGAWQLYIGNKTESAKKRVREILGSEYCRKIMPWTRITEQQMIREFPEIKSKIEVVYPAVPLKMTRKKQNKKPVIIYSARYFKLKGGLIALETLRRLKKKHDIDEIFISDVPENIKREYSEINIGPLVSQKELFDYMKKADIFFYPSFMDTFGFGLIEAMSFGLPIVALKTKDTKTIHEIIEDKKHGFLIETSSHPTEKLGENEEKLIKMLYDKLEILIKNRKLRSRMSKACINEIKNGRFSIKERNKKLDIIYRGAIK